MTFFLPEAPPPETLPPPRLPSAKDANLADVAGAAWEAETIRTDAWGRSQKVREKVLAEIEAEIGDFGRMPEDDAAPDPIDLSVRDGSQEILATRRERRILERANLYAEQNPEAYGGRPRNAEQLDAETNRRLQAEYDEAQDVLAMGSDSWITGTVQFGAEMARAASDELGVAGMIMGLPTGGAGTGATGFFRLVGTEAVMGGVTEALALPRMYRMAERLDIPDPEPWTQVGMGMAGGGFFAGALHMAGRAVKYGFQKMGRARREGEAAGLDPYDTEGGVDAAEQALRDDEPVTIGDGRTEPAEQGGEPTAGGETAVQGGDLVSGGDLAPTARKIVGAESGHRTDAKNPNSSATGPGQVIDSTWLTLIRKYRPDLARGRSDAAILAMRSDYDLSVEMVERYAEQGRDLLRANGLPTGEAEIYLHHFLGPGGVVNVLRREGGTRIAEILPAAVIRANAGVRYGARFFADFTVDDLRRWAQVKMGSAVDPGSGYRPATRAGYTAGNEVVGPGGTRVGVDYEVVDLSSLKAATGRLQPRDRSRAASDEQIAEMAAKLDPARLMPSVEADRGAPIVGPDDIVESGNGRVGAIRRAMIEAPDRYEAYKAAIAAAGFEIPEGVTNPVLIARRTSEMDEAAREAFVREANSSAIARMGPAEQAAADAAGLDEYTLGLAEIGKSLDHPDNRPFVARLMGSLSQAERAALFDRAGRPNVEGLRRLRAALFARAYQAPDLIRELAEHGGGEIRALLEALADAAPAWARLRAAIAEGRIRPEMDTSAQMLAAVRLIGAARAAARTEGRAVKTALEDALAQGDLMAGEVDAITRAYVAIFYKDGRPRAQVDVTEILTTYAQRAEEVGSTEARLFAELDDVSVEDLLDAVKGDDIGSRGGPGDGADARGGGRSEPEGDGAPDDRGRADAETDAGAERAGDAETGPDRSGPPAGREAADPGSVRDLIARDADPEEIAQHPDVQAAVDEIAAQQRTDRMEGYGSEEWWTSRTYRAGDRELAGLEAATGYLHDQARKLAWIEDKLEPGPIRAERQAIVLLGAPAAGKSTVANPIARAAGAAIVDADEAKKIIPEFNRGIGAGAVHEESSEIAAQLLDAVMEAGENVVLPKVGGNPVSIENLIGTLREAGYTVNVVGVEVEPAEAWRRMFGRWLDTGRIIPPEFMRGAVNAPSLTYRHLKEKGAADGFAQIDNTPPRDAPRRILEDERGILAGAGLERVPEPRGLRSDGSGADGPRAGAPGEMAPGGRDPKPGSGPDQTGSVAGPPAGQAIDIAGVREGDYADGASSPEAIAAADQAVRDIEERIRERGDFEITDEHGQKISARALLDDLAEDQEFTEVLGACALNPGSGGRAG